MTAQRINHLARRDRRNEILQIAVLTFAERGKHGARIEEIAESAGVNKALVYYYFDSKDALYREVILFILRQVFARCTALARQHLHQDAALTDSVRIWAEAHFDSFAENKEYAQVILHAISVEPDDVRWAMHRIRVEGENGVLTELPRLLARGVAEGKLRKIDPVQVFISFLGMNLIYFLGKPMGESVLDIRIDDEDIFLAQRKRSVLDLLMSGILLDPNFSEKSDNC